MNPQTDTKQTPSRVWIVAGLLLLFGAILTIWLFWSNNNHQTTQSLKDSSDLSEQKTKIDELEADVRNLKDTVDEVVVVVDKQAAANVSVDDDEPTQVTGGVQGPTGATGAQGLVGVNGTNGADGATGPTGPQGPIGPSGVASCPNGTCLSLQATSPGVGELGNINISGTAIAGSFAGNGAGLTNVDAASLGGQLGSFYQDADNINTGTLSDTQLSPNVSLLGSSIEGSEITNGTITNSDINVTAAIDYSKLNLIGSITNGDLVGGISDSKLSTITTAGKVADSALSGNVSLLGASIQDAETDDILTISSGGNVNWTALNTYPGACAGGSAITQLGDTITCSTFASGTAASYIQNQNSTDQPSDFRISGTGRANTSFITPIVDALSGGTLTLGGANATSITIADDTTIAAGKSLTIAGGNTASRPVSPPEGTVYYDTTAKQLLLYSNGKWQLERADAIYVAAADSSQSDKDRADFVGNGNTAAAADGDQVQINQALTAASGKKVILLAGTYVADATILIPNNTTIEGVGRGTLIELADIDATDNLMENSDTVTGAGVTVQNMRLDGRKDLNTAGTQFGLRMNSMGSGTDATGRQGAKVNNVIVNNFRDRGFSISNSANSTYTNNTAQNNNYGFYLSAGSAGNALTNNVSQGNTSSGFLLDSSLHNIINDNSSIGNGTNGILVVQSNYNTVANNEVRLSADEGIELESSIGNTVKGNTVVGSGDDGIFAWDNLALGSGRNLIEGNLVKDSGNFGISIYQVTETHDTVQNNLIQNSASDGIIINLAQYITVSGNSIIESDGATDAISVAVTAADNVRVVNNHITDTAHSSNNTAIYINATADNTYLAGNTMNSGIDIDDIGTGTITAGQVDDSANFLIQPAGTIELMQDTNLSGNLSVSGTLTVATAVFNGTITVNGHIVSGNTSGSTTIATGAAACTAPSVSLSGNDTAGTITVTTGTGCAATGTLATVTFATAYGSAPRVVLTPTNAVSTTLKYYRGSAAGSFMLNTDTVPTDSTVYEYDYHIIH